ncbi:MAG: flippase-like domain-containing protein, partial [Thermomicrobiaceae bacterium]|nr:flippase-like domain-containing protein [Thermomicrobiaceae bacterium]
MTGRRAIDEPTGAPRVDEATQPDESAARERGFLEKLRRRFVYGLAFGLLVIVGVALLGDGPRLLGTLGRFDWPLLPLVIALTLGNYALRFVKWQLYLNCLGVAGVSRRTSLGIFLAGLTMAITPGKVGEFLKSYLLRRATGTPMARTAPIIVAERATDGLAMLVLAALGLLSVRYGWPVLVGLALAMLIGIVILQRRALVLRLLAWFERFPVAASRMHALHDLYESTYVLFQPRNLAAAVGLGVVSWSGECLAFFLILVGLGLPASLEMLLTATFILATATILGSLSMLPGGLGAAEASVAALLLLLVHDARMTSD